MLSEEVLALSLRVRALSTVVTGQPEIVTNQEQQQPFSQRYEQFQAEYRNLIAQQSSEAIRRFVQSYDSNAPLLEPSFTAVSDTPASSLSTLEKATLILESEQEILALERTLRDLHALEQQGVTGVGNLEKHVALRPDLDALQESVKSVAEVYSAIEDQATDLLEQYNNYVNGISESFISLNKAITAAETVIRRIENEHD